MRSYGPGIESRVQRAQGGRVNPLPFREGCGAGLAAKLSNNSNEELLCKN
jgi:hypothetical protein